MCAGCAIMAMTAVNGVQRALAVVPARWRRRGAAVVLALGIAGATVGLSGSTQSPATPPDAVAAMHPAR